MVNSKINIQDVCGIVVTYNPNIEELKENLDSVFNQVGGICIVDNSTDQVLQQEILDFRR